MCETAQFSRESAKACLRDIIEALECSENAVKLNEAKTNAGNCMLRTMQYVFPIVVQIEMDVIKNYGFSDNRDGIIQFTHHIVALEREDAEIADLHAQIRSRFLPPMNTSSAAAL